MTKLELKAKHFAPKYVANNMNGTKTVEELQPEMSHHVAKSRATEMLSNPVYNQAIKDYLEESEGNRVNRNLWMIRNAKQITSYSSSNASIDMLNKIAGDYAPERRENVSLTLTGEDLKEAIRLLQAELTNL